MLKPHEKHRAEAPRSLSFHIITVSSSRYMMKLKGEKFIDESGDLANQIIERNGHTILRRGIISDDISQIKVELNRFLRSRADVLILIGGTGVSRKDITIEAVRPFFEKELEGFGEILRNVSYQGIGSAAILTRACAGIKNGKLIICLPGSPDAVKTGLELFIGEFPHIVHIARL